MRKLIDADALLETIRRNHDWRTLLEMQGYIDAMPDAGCARDQRTTQFCAESVACMRDLAIARNLASMAEGLMQAHKEKAEAAQAELDRLRDKYRMAWELAHFAMDISDPEAKALYIDEIWRVMEGE